MARDPLWSTATASGNDVLRLTSGTSYFTALVNNANWIYTFTGGSLQANAAIIPITRRSRRR